MAKDYIPRGNSQFHNFQQVLVKAVMANATSWGIPAADVTELADASTAYNSHYKIISNKQSCTSAQRVAYYTCRTGYEKQIRYFVNRYLRDNKSIPVGALTGMSIKVKAKRRNSRSAIDQSVELRVTAMDGCRAKFYCCIPNHDGGASLHPEADAVEIRYTLQNKPANWKDCPYTLVTKKARVVIELEQAMLGKNIYAFARWVNLSNHGLSGPFGNMAHIMLH